MSSPPSPMTPTETQVAAVFVEMIPCQSAGPDDDLFGLGGDSLSGLQIVLAPERRFEVDIPMEMVEDCASIAQIARFLDDAVSRSAAPDKPPVKALKHR